MIKNSKIFIFVFCIFGFFQINIHVLNAQTTRCSFPGDTPPCNSTVNILDFTFLSTNFGTTNVGADFNTDNTINVIDFTILSTNFGKTAVSTPTPPQPSPTPTITPTPTPTGPTPTQGQISNEWTQHGFNAQRTSYNPQSVSLPWRWKWSWNGPNSSGTVSKVTSDNKLPRNVQAVTGNNKIFISGGTNGIYALNQQDSNNDRIGDTVWNRNNIGTINSTVAYDPATNSVFALNTSGLLHKLNATNGTTIGSFQGTGGSTLPLPPAVYNDNVFFSTGNNVYAINKNTMAQIWSYAAGSAVDTPPSYSPSKNKVIVGTADLYVHAINNTDGQRAWRVKPTTRNTPCDVTSNSCSTGQAEMRFGWPVIAEQHGYVLIKYRLDWDALWNYGSTGAWPSTNEAMQSYLQSSNYQALFALNLDNGTQPFIANVGAGGYGNGGYLPLGPMPVVKINDNGTETAYVVMRGSPCDRQPCDGRWDTHLGELLLDSSSVPGWNAGFVRFMQSEFFPTDEQPYISMAGNQIFAGHWVIGTSRTITDRGPTLGSGTNPIKTSPLRNIASVSCGANYGASHYSSNSTISTEGGGCPRVFAGPGFYSYYTDSKIYDNYWSNYADWTVSNNLILHRTLDGAIIVLENGTP